MGDGCLKGTSLKIYGVTSVGPKGQVIIPRETRRDYDIDIGDEFFIAIVDNIAFGIGKREGVLKEKIKKIVGIGQIVIGTKYQFVIPNIIRKKLNINYKDSLVLIGKPGEGIGFIKNNEIDYVFEFIKKELNA